ncbi:CFDP2 protein, partial [Atractosteus spatula]|nr:CFDP2 protein [Atractosteus spatula]
SQKSREIGEGYKLIYHGKKTTQNGVGVVVSQWIHDSVTEVARITDRLMSTKISMGTSTLGVVSCYAPQAGCPDEEKEKFWHDLETHVQAIDDSEIIFIGGGLNGHVGRAKDNFDRNHGGQGHSNRNEGGIRILEHAEAWDLAITNTFFKKRESKPQRDQPPRLNTSMVEITRTWKLPEHVKATLGPLVPNPRSTVGEDWNDLAERIKTCAATTLGTTSTPTALPSKTRVSAAWMKWQQVTGVLCDKIPLRLKSKAYRSVVRPVALYGTECWPTTKKHEQALHTMEMKMLQWTLGLTRLDHVMNEGVRKTLKVTPKTEKMTELHLRWYGYVLRSNDTSMAKTALELNVEGRRPRGRPFMRWLDQLKDDMRLAKVTCRDAADRMKWKNQFKQADPT